MREVELKSMVPDPAGLVVVLSVAGAELRFAGELADRRYDTPDRALTARDHVLRVREYRDRAGARATLDWKGATSYEAGYKVREELSTDAADAGALATMLERLGYAVIREIEREIHQFIFRGATVRIEQYPRMDALVEVEGTPESIEAAIAGTGLPRDGFTPDRLPAFINRFERRTGERAAVCRRELTGDYRYSASDA
jgi:predicted adenylyl cyclase CyaB